MTRYRALTLALRRAHGDSGGFLRSRQDLSALPAQLFTRPSIVATEKRRLTLANIKERLSSRIYAIVKEMIADHPCASLHGIDGSADQRCRCSRRRAGQHQGHVRGGLCAGDGHDGHRTRMGPGGGDGGFLRHRIWPAGVFRKRAVNNQLAARAVIKTIKNLIHAGNGCPSSRNCIQITKT